MNTLRFAILGTGFWARYQLAAWREIEGVECVALYNRTRSKAEWLAERFGVPQVYDDAEKLLQHEQLDFIDIITDVDTHSKFAHMAAAYGIPVICQKPMAPTLADAEAMVQICQKANVPLLIHENWRWQAPIRQVRHMLDEGLIGVPFFGRIDMMATTVQGLPFFANQPFLKELEQFILTDLGSHILDTARFLFGEARSLYCQTSRVHNDIKGEDVATVMLNMGQKTTVVCHMAYAESPLERDCFPQTFLFIEGDKGSIELGSDYWIRLTTQDGTLVRRYAPPRYDWADPRYEVVHASIVPCNRDMLGRLRGGATETTGEDNLRTLRLVYAAYESAASDRVITFGT
jgi:predicted dehydrogenase